VSYNVVISADFGASNTGLTVHGKLFGTNGAQVGSTITSGFAEAVSGLYVYVLSAPDSQEGVFVAYDSANTALRRVAVIAPRETENADTKTSAAQAAIIAAVPTVAEIDTELSDNHGDGSWEDTGAGLTAAQVWSYATRTLTALGSAAGVEFTYTVTDSATTNPIADVSVWFSTNVGITNVVWYGSTDAFGVARDANGNKPRLDTGTYFILCRKTGFSFTVDTETVSA
jgi:hypothetical protein